MSLELVAKSRDISIACLSEARIPGIGCISTHTPNPSDSVVHHKHYRIYHSGPTDNSGQRGVAIAVSSRCVDHVTEWIPVSDRLAMMRLNTVPFPTTIICCYAPTNAADAAVKDDFYDQLTDRVEAAPRSDFLVIAGDFNATLGPRLPSEQPCLGSHTIGIRKGMTTATGLYRFF